MRSIRIAALIVLASASFANAQTSEPAAAAASITPAAVKAHIAFLASDSLKGRDTPSPGLESAARYVADHFRQFGLKPAGDSGTFVQRWPYQTRKLEMNSASVELSGKQRRSLKLGGEYFVIPAVAGDSLAGTVTFVGAAAPSMPPNNGWAGKIVVFNLPGGEVNDAWAKPLQGAAIAAISSGAKGVVFLLDKDFTADDVGNAVANIQGVLTPVPIIGVRGDVTTDWTGDNAAIAVRTKMTAVNGSAPNVIGILEGSDAALKDTYVVFSAHMDHIGVSTPNAKGDSINNGADDDASGTTAVLEVAKAFTSLKVRPKRSVIFLGVSGEEKGLLGSKYFTEHLPVPADKIVADINIDMIGRNNADTTVAIGQDYTSLGKATQVVTKSHPELHLTVANDLWPDERLFFRSDHFNFAMKQIPAIFFTSGLHDDYHKPSDEPQTIDNDKLARTARLVFWLGLDVANNSVAPTWTEEGRKAVAAAASEQ